MIEQGASIRTDKRGQPFCQCGKKGLMFDREYRYVCIECYFKIAFTNRLADSGYFDRLCVAITPPPQAAD